jgi:hypothetical protein
VVAEDVRDDVRVAGVPAGCDGADAGVGVVQVGAAGFGLQVGGLK